MPALLLETAELQALLDQKSDVILVDVGSAERFQNAHIPGAVLVTPGETQAGPPFPGFCPSDDSLTRLMQGIGLTAQSHVVVYDDEGGGWAGRFIWILDEIGHTHYSHLNGGLQAWASEERTLESGLQKPEHSSITVAAKHNFSVTLAEVVKLLNESELQIWDARSPLEYRGEALYAARGGHIPGAVNYEWTRAMDQQNSFRLKPLKQLEAELLNLGLNKDKATITHCQTHHRSGLTYLLAKLIGFQNIKAYPGSWGEWGNHPETPIET